MMKRVTETSAPDFPGGVAQARFVLLFRIGFLVSFLLVGLYYELTCALISVYLMMLLLWRGRQAELCWRINDAALAAFGIWLFYVLTCLWAVDPGIALWGAVKYLPLPLAAICLLQLNGEERRSVLGDLPWIGGGMTLVSFLLQYIPAFTQDLVVNGRLAGFFQYPNTFACFLLLGLELLLLKPPRDRSKPLCILCGALLLFGIVQAGSRTVFLLALPASLLCLALRRSKGTLLLAAGSLGGGVLLSIPVALLSQALSGADRITEISASASTLLGRLLYWKDALPVILENPMGLGYLGYYMTQGSFQTGVYTVRWVHNDFLQLLLDIGWLPGILAVIAVVTALFSKRSDALRRIVLLTLLAHCMLDFDLEFVSMYFVVLLCLDWEQGKAHAFAPESIAVPSALCAILSAGGLYLGTASALTYGDFHETAAAIYPWNTLSNLQLLTQAEDAEEMSRLAEQILAQNEQVALAWDARAEVAYSQGDFSTVIEAKQKAISLAKYEIEEYIDYFEKLRTGSALYLAAGDTESAAVCEAEIASIQDLLDQVLEETDPLAWQIDDQPELEMPEEYTAYVSGAN